MKNENFRYRNAYGIDKSSKTIACGIDEMDKKTTKNNYTQMLNNTPIP
jgi:hypothetical protein